MIKLFGGHFLLIIFFWCNVFMEIVNSETSEDCTPRRSVGLCGRCVTNNQCQHGFCCPFMKACVQEGFKICNPSITHVNVALCTPKCYSNMDPYTCKCKNKHFPERWPKPTCKRKRPKKQRFK